MTSGPYDAGDRDPQPGEISWGALRLQVPAGAQMLKLPSRDGSEINGLEVIIGASSLRLFVHAGPKSGGGWARLLERLVPYNERSATVERREGPWGEELYVENEQKGASRIIGLDGKRWILRMEVRGRALAFDEDREQIEDFIRTICVFRDAQPRPALSIIALSDPRMFHGS